MNGVASYSGFGGASTWGWMHSGYLSHSESPFDKSTSRVRVKIVGLRLVGGNPDFTNAPGHGDDDARFYDRQQAYVHARGGWLPRHPN